MDEQNNTNNIGQQTGGSSGPVVGVIIILVVVILAGLYFWGQRGVENIDESNTEAITTQSEADDTDSIENDLNNTDVEVDAEINAS
ncbi:MAG: hypothetical protein A2832_02175 [Candidatus Zambryskibacteria bacterium RIFCSPHIGHO2_01_FULL_44_22b]|uniref:Uncharacterized protein n=2 Tax=Candidatus Zambryskiibacteriota TaxID=1817925 RepID=A0A1G2SZX5_9BACT|nr:MAG: hypothetical protein A2832_02175 [Candidatus Zambryskibacteria bacterium RIFCSPHIGHO2_01_FULL_44_22b]OHB05501.1 MAG: hypothetical protein A3B16_00190 [Candidatus Zambryskibacteria bacterium RIFCSPLOWO2_01_FULL_45_43]